MTQINPSTLAIALMLLLSGCCTNQPLVTQPELPAAKLLRPSQAAYSSDKIGLALSGGGTKAASYAMGVLARLAQSDNELSRIDAISSVSGGSYASLFLFSKLMLQDTMNSGNKPKKIGDFFSDCMPSYYQEQGVLPTPDPNSKLVMPKVCSKKPNENESYRFQQYLRCRQDVLQTDCKPEMDDKTDTNEIASMLGLIGETAGIFVPNFIARTIFDWPVNLSRTRHAYQEGIWSTYAWFPTRIEAANHIDDINDVAQTKADSDENKPTCYFLHCQQNSADTSSGQLTFQRLEDTLNNDKEHKYPTWFINATASRKRSFLGWALPGQRDFTQYTMQMSPYRVRSGLYGDFDTDPNNDAKFDLNLLEAVTASAAFADANETILPRSLKFLGALLLHLGGQDWGHDIDNPNVAEGWRYLHNALPFPLYYTDGTLRYLSGQTKDKTRSSYVHLMDGGNNDDLGAFTLIEAGMKQIFIADSAQDDKGDLEDVCLLHNEIRIRNLYGAKVKESKLENANDARKLIIPGLEGLENHCLNLADESANNPNKKVRGVNGPKTNGHYSIYDWKHKVLVGCIRKGTGNTCDSSQAGEIDAKIFLLKPAINLDEMKTHYVDIATKRVNKKACDEQANPGLCEVAAYIADSYDPTDEEHHGLGKFPQDSTAGMTANSDAKRYGAYRELGRWHMHEALELSKDQAKFDTALDYQSKNKISYDAEAN